MVPLGRTLTLTYPNPNPNPNLTLTLTVTLTKGNDMADLRQEIAVQKASTTQTSSRS